MCHASGPLQQELVRRDERVTPPGSYRGWCGVMIVSRLRGPEGGCRDDCVTPPGSRRRMRATSGCSPRRSCEEPHPPAPPL
eukprot:283190-Prorocentrum_minimum.AAC.1